MILFLRRIIFIYFILKFKTNKNLSYIDLNFRKIDFTNYSLIKLFIFKNNFYKTKNKIIHSFDFLNFSNKLGGKVGINLSKKSIFGWYKINKNKLKNALNSTSFEKLKQKEKAQGFSEAVSSITTNKKITFFNLGPKNDWKKMLDKKIRNKIEEAFKKEMVELGYL